MISIYEIGPKWLLIDSIQFHGQFARSRNGNFMFAWQDFDYLGGRVGGRRDHGLGRVALINNKRLMWQRDLERPNDGSVANSGHAAVNDWLFGDGLNGTFYVFSPEGDTIIESHFAANLMSCGLTDDGTIAWCSTARANDEEDSRRLSVFTVVPPKRLFKTDVLYGNVSEVTVSDEAIHVVTDQKIPYRFSFDGGILNEETVNAAIDKSQIENGSSWDLLGIVESRWQQRTFDQDGKRVDDVFELMDLASERTDDSRMIARIERRKGEFRLELGDKEQALIHFKKALAVDPKIGVKKLAAKIESELGEAIYSKSKAWKPKSPLKFTLRGLSFNIIPAAFLLSRAVARAVP